MNDLIEFIVARRKSLGLSQRDLSKFAGLGAGTLANIELGRVTRAPSFDTLQRLARGLRVDIADLESFLIGEQEKTRKPWPGHDSRQTSAAEQGHQTVTNGKLSGRTGINSADTEVHSNSRQTNQRVPLPVYEIACGEPIIIPDQPIEYEEWPASIAGNAKAIMRVRGNSMIGCGFKPGDRLFVRLLDGELPESGDTVVASIGEGATCKIFRRDPLQGPVLESAPGEQVPVWRIPVTNEVRLIGVVDGIYQEVKRR